MSLALKKYAPETYALMRIVAGFLFFWHGSQKLFGFPAAAHQAPAWITYGAGSVELLGGLLVAVGLYAGWAAFISSGEMAVAYWTAHGTNDPWPLNNGGELAALYCFVFLCIAAHGAGIWSVDAARARSV
jgi:putative oxidoreductase